LSKEYAKAISAAFRFLRDPREQAAYWFRAATVPPGPGPIQQGQLTQVAHAQFGLQPGQGLQRPDMEYFAPPPVRIDWTSPLRLTGMRRSPHVGQVPKHLPPMQDTWQSAMPPPQPVKQP
jgi:hypothetical protein